MPQSPSLSPERNGHEETLSQAQLLTGGIFLFQIPEMPHKQQALTIGHSLLPPKGASTMERKCS